MVIFEPTSMVGWLMVGLMAGAIANQFLSRRSFGMEADIGIGVLVAFAGGLSVSLGTQGQANILASMTAAFVGAVLVSKLGRALPRGSTA